MSAGERFGGGRGHSDSTDGDDATAGDATVVSRRRRAPQTATSTLPASTPADAALSSARTAYSPDLSVLSAPYPPRSADPVIAIRRDAGPSRV